MSTYSLGLSSSFNLLVSDAREKDGAASGTISLSSTLAPTLLNNPIGASFVPGIVVLPQYIGKPAISCAFTFAADFSCFIMNRNHVSYLKDYGFTPSQFTLLNTYDLSFMSTISLSTVIANKTPQISHAILFSSTFGAA